MLVEPTVVATEGRKELDSNIPFKHKNVVLLESKQKVATEIALTGQQRRPTGSAFGIIFVTSQLNLSPVFNYATPQPAPQSGAFFWPLKRFNGGSIHNASVFGLRGPAWDL